MSTEETGTIRIIEGQSEYFLYYDDECLTLIMMTGSKFFTNLPIERKLLLISAVPMVALIILSVVTYKSVQTFSHHENWLNQVYHVQSDSAEYMRLVVDIETGFRGFVLTTQPRFLQPYQAAKTRIHTLEKSLHQMVHKREPQLHLLQQVQHLVQQLMADKDSLIERVKSGHSEAVLEYIDTGKGRALMSSIREKMARFDRQEVELLRQALANSAQDRSTLLAVILWGGAIALILMLLPLHLIARSITGPLISLAKQVGGAPLGTIPDVHALTRQDEIGDLTRVMHAMSEQITTHIAQIKRTKDELRALNRTLAASEEKYRCIVEYAPIGIFTTQGPRIMFCNPQAWALAGANPQKDKDPESMWEAIHPEDRAITYQAFVTAIRQGIPFKKVFRFLHPDGSVRKIFSLAVPLNNQGGQSVIYQGFHVDITALEHMRAQLNRAERLATLGQVAAGIAHEIRNPLVGIGSTTSLLLEDSSDEEGRQKDLATILQETQRLDRIVNQIVDYARPRNVVPTTFPVNAPLEETIHLLNQPLSQKAVQVEYPLSESLPPLEADRDQIKQVFLNILQNAIEAIPAGGSLRITASETLRDQDQGVLITFHDNGKGINPSLLPRIFEPFFTTGKPQGSGLGLAICRNIIDAHGGDIQVHSSLGQGTVVSLWLPCSQHLQFSSL